MVGKAVLQFEEDQAPARIETIALAEIQTDDRVQPRCRLDPSIIATYADLMIDGVEFPPVIAVRVNDGYLLVDGYLRYEAAKLVGLQVLKSEVRRGDLRTALLLSAEVNGKHGVRPTREDKRRSVCKLLNDAEWRQWSDREIAKRCGVSHGMVGQLRWEVTGKVTSDPRFVNKHGSVSSMNVTAIRARPAVAPMVTIPVIAAAKPAKSAEVTSISEFTRDFRGEFVESLREIEMLFDRLPPISSVLDVGRSGNSALAGRLSTIARKASEMAERLRGNSLV